MSAEPDLMGDLAAYLRTIDLARTANQREDHTPMSTSPDFADREELQDPDAPEQRDDHSSRQRGPATYDVYRQNSGGNWEPLARSVEATSRRGAVTACFSDPTEDGAFGQFLVVRSNEAKVLTREKKVIPETIADDWS